MDDQSSVAEPDEHLLLRLVREHNCTPMEAEQHVHWPYLKAYLDVDSYITARDRVQLHVADQERRGRKGKPPPPSYPEGYWVRLHDRNEERLARAKRVTAGGSGPESLAELIRTVRETT